MITTPFLQVQDLTFRYLKESTRNTIEQANLTLDSQKSVLLLGNSGCGKSTLASLIAGIYPENGGVILEGNIKIENENLHSLSILKRTKKIAMMFQNPDLQFCMDTLRKEMIFCLENLCVAPQEMDQLLYSQAEEFQLEELLDQKFSTLSGGQKQRAVLCCLFLLPAQCFILDEPFSNLDSTSISQLMAMLKKKKLKDKTAFLIIDHHVEPWLDFIDEITILQDQGKTLVQHIQPIQLGKFQLQFEQEGLFFLKPRPSFQPRTSTSPILLSLNHVTVGYSHRSLLENCHAQFHQGTITSILGPSGCGKTTLFSVLLKQKSYTGTIQLLNQDLSSIHTKNLYKIVGTVFQSPANQFIKIRVLDEVMQSLAIWKPTQTLSQRKQEAIELLDSYHLRLLQNYSCYMLSQGQQRRLAVLSVLSGNQKILLLDEPTYGQDEKNTRVIMSQLRQLCQQGLTVLITTHDVDCAMTYSDQILEIKGRRLCLWQESIPQ